MDRGKFIKRLIGWHKNDSHKRIIDSIEKLPRSEWDFEISGLYARALNNLDRYEEALDQLFMFQKEGREDGVWNFRVGYSLYYLNREAEAAEYFQKAIDFGDDGEDTREMLQRSIFEADRKKTADNITIYTAIGDFSRVKKALIARFFEAAKEAGNTADNENGAESFTIRFYDDAEITLSINTRGEYINRHISGMYTYFARAECKNTALHKSVLNQIRLCNCIIGCSFMQDDNENRAGFIYNAMFAAAKDINGIVLLRNMSLFSGDGKLLLSIEGASDFDEYNPIGNADFLDAGKEETVSDIARRRRSIAVLEKKGIPYIPHLPAAVLESDAKVRPPEEIAGRLFAMFAVCAYCEALNGGANRNQAQKYLHKVNAILNGGLDAHLTPKEKVFLSVDSPEQRDLVNFSWRYECCYALMWSLGFVKEPAYPEQVCNVSEIAETLWNQDGLPAFLALAKPRSEEEILDAADLILRYDWACVDARIHGKESPAGLNSEVVAEWHYAFNWLIGANNNADWDDISPDT
ncbi:MAG: DUF4272 domain-containing protein [Spirochaetaceae bacterium]|jgi:tetratricopeptide (TPR) repeat protein|nr:DUF4272 domain-containing protein [Spirochaetaceae bacterium]